MVIDEEVANDFVAMSSREIHCASHIERPAWVQWHQSKARRTADSSVIVACYHRPQYIRGISGSDISRRRVWENVDYIAALELFSDISECSDR